jgi:valine--pyruvate aminotransferase
MEDLGAALTDDPTLLFMGGGNPGRIEAVQQAFVERVEWLLDDRERRHRFLGVYQSPQGDREFREALAAYLRRRCAWDVGPEHIAVANGSQSAFFVIANLFAGAQEDGGQGTLHLPLAPEYVGYRDAGLSEPFFTASRPAIERIDDAFFKYHIDVASLDLPETTRALCVSRPSNPTGNVIGDAEMAQLDELARAADVPLIVDGAYGLPFPGIVYGEARAHWNDNTILLLSLSKLGLPGVRTGIVVARPEIAGAFARANTVMSLASGTLGPAMLTDMLQDGSLDGLCSQAILPFYRERRERIVAALRTGLDGLPVRLHRPEGAFFLWLWCEGCPVDSMTLYERLKARGVVVLPGQDFFIGTGDDWPHRHECLRLSYAGDPTTISAGAALVADELRRAYAGG